MKKIIIFLISLTIMLLLPNKNVYAKTHSFYQGEYIPNIFIHKITQSKLDYYSQARFIRKTNTNEIAYCVEPSIYFEDGQSYEDTKYLSKFTPIQILDMTLISHFGYGYPGHTDPKWYPITQTLIWKIADPSMKYHMTVGKDPNTNHLFTKEMEEIRTLVNNYKKTTSLNNKTYTIVAGQSLTLVDENNVLINYTSKDNIEIKDNKLIINNPQPGTNIITLEKEHKLYNRHPLFYTSKGSQNVMDVGDPLTIKENFKVKVLNTEVEILKVDSETKENFPQGEASLIGSIFGLFKKDNTLIQEITLDDITAKIKNLPFGSYYIKELKPGIGYELNPNKYPLEINETTTNIQITIPNKVIKGKLIIKKEFGSDNNFKPEQNISFNIYHQDKLIKTITTNELGIAEIELPYGKYKIIQLTTSEGYEKIEPIEFEINSPKELTYKLKDYKIDVPNTKSSSFIEKLINLIKKILCGKK